MVRKICVVALLLFTANAVAAEPATSTAPAAKLKWPAMPEGAKYLRDVSYVTNGGPRQKLDIVTLASEKPVPLIVYIHGGGWMEGNKSVARAAPFIFDGYAVAAINYRFSTDAVFPAQIEDCKAAIRFLRAHAKEYNIDPDKIGVWGESAGGHLAALLGTSAGAAKLTGDKPENATVSDAVQCVVDYFGPTDLEQLPAMAPPGVKYDPKVWPGTLLTALLGGTLEEKKELADSANPIAYVTKAAPPFLIVHGTADPLVPIAQSKILFEALIKAGAVADFVPVEKAGHGTGIYGKPEVWKKVQGIFATALKGEKPAEAKGTP